jgi:fused signal recognition particle receptor
MFNIFKKNNTEDSSAASGFFGLRNALAKTKESLIDSIASLTSGKEAIDEDLLEDLEETFIKADLGILTAERIVKDLKDSKSKANEVHNFLKDKFLNILKEAGSNNLNIKENQLNILLITGVNGAGKTTLIGKLAYRFKKEGKTVVVAAGDTFRAAAEDQLEIWTNRAGAKIVRKDGADPASVVYDSIKEAKETNADILIIDTAGRLQNKINLMEELKKIKKVIYKEAPTSLVESMLVLDASTGQNGLKQAEVFEEAVQLTSIGLTKLDGSSKGGIIISIADRMKLPVKLIGIGEGIEDLKDFNPNDFVEALFSPN